MLKLIKADLYKSFHRIYLYVFMGVLAAISCGYNIILAYAGFPREASFQIILNFLVFPLFFVSMFVDIITAEENKEHTLKNAVSFGTSRNKLYLAKNISAVIVAAVVAAVTLVVFYVSAVLFLKPGEKYSQAMLSGVMLKIAVALLLYIAAIALATLLASVIKRNALFAFAYIGALIVPYYLLKLMNYVNPIFGRAQYLMLMVQSSVVAQGTPAQLLTAVWIALAHIAVFVTLGLFLFKRQEIN